MRQIYRGTTAWAATRVLMLLGTVLAPAASAFVQWEWQAVGIAENDFLTIIIPGPSTTFSTKEEALTALQSQSFAHLKIFTGARRSKTGGIDYYFAAPKAEVTFGSWRYNQGGNLPCGQADSQEAILECVANYYEAQSCPNGVIISIPPIATWIATPTFPHEREGGNTSFSAPECGISNRTVGIERQRNLTCPSGYSLITSVPSCVNNYSAVVRSRPLECPTGSPKGDVGNPCNVATGDKFQSQTDYRAPGLTFTRSYHSAAMGADATLGVGWTHSYSSRMLIDQGVPKILIRPSGYHESLEFGQSLSGTGTRVVESGSQWLVYLSNGDVETYTSGGELTRIRDRFGQITSLTYANDPVTATRRLSSVVGVFGHRIDFSYSNDRIASITDTGGVATQYSYDAKDNLSRVTYQGGLFREYLYEDTRFPNHLTGIIDESGNRFSTYTYDSIGRAIRTEHAGATEWHEISYGGTSSTVLNSSNLQTVFNFGGMAHEPRRISSIVRAGQTTSYGFEFGSQRRISQETDARGFVTKFIFSDDHLLSKTEAFGTAKARTTSYAYRSNYDDLPTLITESGRTTSFSYHPTSGYLLTKTITDTTLTPNVSRTWTYTHNTFGQVLTEDGPRTDVNDITTWTYHTCTTGFQCGQVNTITNALGHITTYNSYDAHGQPTQITDANGLVTSLGYDERQRLTHRCVGGTLPSCTGGELTTLAYWPTGLVKKVTSPDGSFIEYLHDNAHRLTEIKDGALNRIVYTLDPAGNRTAENTYDPSSALKRTHSWVFNSLNQLWKDVNAAGTAAVTTMFGYDANGNQTTTNAPLSRNSTNAYDELNRLNQITDPYSGVTAFGYDANDNLTSITDPRSLVTSYTYTGFGDLKTQVSPDTGTTTNTYDSGGNLKTSTDARSAITTYTYDELNRVKTAAFKIGSTTDQTITFTYDGGSNQKGQLTGASDSTHTMAWVYDTKGRVTGKTQTYTGVSPNVPITLGYGYNTLGQMASLVLPSGRTITYGYNANNQVTSVTLLGSPNVTILSNITYDPFGPITGWTWGNAQTTSRLFDADGKLTAIGNSIAAVGNRTFGFDDAFRITSSTDTAASGPSWAFGYDILDRLNSATKTGTTIGYTYDANGNRLTQTGTSASTHTVSTTSNRLSSVSCNPLVFADRSEVEG